MPSFSSLPVIIALLMISGSLSGIYSDLNTISPLMQEENSWVGPPGAGSANATIISTTYLNGNHAYDDLYIGCGIVAPCGSIIANGSLILTVNTLTVASGASIIANGDTHMAQGLGTLV